MSTFRILLAAMIIVGGGYIGMIFAADLYTRVRQLEQLRLALEQMSFSISFLKLPVAEALYAAARSRQGAIGRILSGAAKDIGENGIAPSAAVAIAVGRNRDFLCMRKSDIDILNEFASGLGTGDAESELSNIRAACARLKIAQTTAEGERDRKAKMWRGIGFLGGIFAVIMLF